MTPYWSDDWLTVYQGDCREVMRSMEPESVHCVVTSPPYWGLRDYGTATWAGGDPECEHEVVDAARTPWANDVSGPNGRGKNLAATHWKPKETGGRCAKCAAVRRDDQVGLERTPDEYVAKLVHIFREVRRVLRSDGTAWLNLGDCYATGAGSVGESPGGGEQGARWAGTAGRGHRGQHLPNQSGKQAPRVAAMGPMTQPNRMPLPGLKAKDLVGVPWMVAFALRSDGWWLRRDVIWSKPNGMPESVEDRPTSSHEYVFLLTKAERYWYDHEAVRERRPANEIARSERGYRRVDANPTPGLPPGATPHTGLHLAADPSPEATSRNLRSVWTIATQPYPGAHFATFPEKLVERMLLAGCPVGGVVLDPFGGSGTVGQVARALGRRAILIELNPDYVRQAIVRATAGLVDPGGHDVPDDSLWAVAQ